MKKLAVATLIYISAPSFIFVALWLKPVYASIAFICLFAALFTAVRRIPQRDESEGLGQILWSSSLISFAVCLCSEFGAVSYQSFDYIAHNYKLHLLSTNELPLYNSARDLYMCYYLGYYIIPALLGKCTLLAYVKIYFFLWTWLGVAMAFAWIQISMIQLNATKRILACVLIIAGSYVSILLPTFKWVIEEAPIQNGNTVLIPGNFLLNQIPVLTRGLSESTQHTIPSILGISFILGAWSRPGYLYALMFFVGSTLFISPFATIGLFPFLLILFIQHLKKDGIMHTKRIFLYLMPLSIAFLPVLLFLSSSEATSMASNKMIWETTSSLWWLYYIIYLFASYGIWILLFRKELFAYNRTAVLISIAFICFISFFQIGHYNDLHIRSTTGIQFVFGAAISYIIVSKFETMLSSKSIVLGILFWFLNTVAPFKFFYDRIFVLEGHRNTIEHPELAEIQGDYYETMEKSYLANGKEVVKQYSLKKNTLFEKYLLEK